MVQQYVKSHYRKHSLKLNDWIVNLLNSMNFFCVVQCLKLLYPNAIFRVSRTGPLQPWRSCFNMLMFFFFTENSGGSKSFSLPTDSKIFIARKKDQDVHKMSQTPAAWNVSPLLILCSVLFQTQSFSGAPFPSSKFCINRSSAFTHFTLISPSVTVLSYYGETMIVTS